jgi:hypothetical protein
MPEIADLMNTNLLKVFGERDPDKRRAAIERTYTEAVVFSDPDEVVTGREALDTKAQKILDDAPGFVFSPGGKIYVNHDLGYLAWNFGPEGAAPVVRGVDVALVRDGLIASMYTLLLND